VTAVVARVLVILGLFLLTDHQSVAFGHLFGDEEYFIRRSLWMRNLVLGLPMHRADVIYAYDRDIRTSFLYVLATLQLLFGPAPYGAHVFSILCYLGASIVLYRLVRPSFGRLPALLGLAILLFLPTQFAWSLSALKEPFYFLALSVGLMAAVTAGRPGPALRRIEALLVLAVSAVVAQSVREGGFVMAGAGAAAGLLFGAFERRRWLILPFAAMCLLGAVLAATHGLVKDRVVVAVRRVAGVHWSQVNTPGYAYTVLDPGFYARRNAVDEMTLRDGVRYVAGSFVAYVAVPLPWKMQSRTALIYLPEQIVWYLLLLFAPAGIIAGFRRDAQLTALLAAYAAAAALLVALTSGNVGTLVRHRGLAVPYLVWLSVLGACETVTFLTARGQDPHAHH
jgi:4-amino-4-deoxy-L-arabinose transferase-like glycosyltransferase